MYLLNGRPLTAWCAFNLDLDRCIMPLTDVTSKCPFACDLLTIWYHEQVLAAIISLAMSYPVLAMVHPRWSTCNYLLTMATRNNHYMKMFEL